MRGDSLNLFLFGLLGEGRLYRSPTYPVLILNYINRLTLFPLRSSLARRTNRERRPSSFGGRKVKTKKVHPLKGDEAEVKPRRFRLNPFGVKKVLDRIFFSAHCCGVDWRGLPSVDAVGCERLKSPHSRSEIGHRVSATPCPVLTLPHDAPRPCCP